MPQFNKGETFADGQQVTGVRLNNLIDGATILSGAITDQTNITANTVASGDSILLYDLSATALREANVSDVLGSNLPVTTSAVTAGANSDILITPNDGVIVTGQAYTSGDGLTVTVTSTAHLLTVGQVILVTAAGTGYNGTFRVATVLTNSFTYVMPSAATAGSSTLSYTKKGLVKNPANKSIAGNLYVDGSTIFAGDTTLAGANTLAGATTASSTFTSSGTANFTGAIQYNGTPVFGLYEVAYEQIPEFNATVAGNQPAVWTSNAFTKPSDEIWEFELSYNYTSNVGYSTMHGARYASQTLYSGTYKFVEVDVTVNSNSTVIRNKLARWVEGVGITLTAETLKIDANSPSFANLKMFFVSTAVGSPVVFTGFTTLIAPSIFRIYKYKTA